MQAHLTIPTRKETPSREGSYCFDGKEHKRGSRIGSGTYSDVYELVSLARQREVFKELKLPSETEVLENDAKYAEQYLGPTTILRDTKRHGLVGVVQPHVPGKTLSEYSFSSIPQFLKVCAAVFEALEKMHVKSHVHGDPSKNNIKLISHNGKVTATLIDFGFTRSEGDETIGRRAGYQPEELKNPVIARPYQDNITFLTVAREIYNEMRRKQVFESYGVEKLFDSILQQPPAQCPSAAQLAKQFRELEAFNYFIIRSEIEIARITEKDRYDSFKETIAYFSPQFVDFVADVFKGKKLKDIIFIASTILDGQCCEENRKMVINRLKFFAEKDPKRLVEILQLLPRSDARSLFFRLGLNDNELTKLSKIIFERSRNNFDAALAWIDCYCKHDLALYKKMLLLFNQEVYQQFIQDKISKLSCVSALFYQSNYEKKLIISRNLEQLSANPEKLEGKLRRMAVRIHRATR